MYQTKRMEAYCLNVRTKGEEVVEIKIPAGVAEGMVVNIPGKGNAAPHNGIAGDIQVLIEEEENDSFVS